MPVHAAANSWSVLSELAAAGLGLARVPEYLAAPAIARGELVAVLAPFQPPPEQLFAVYARTRQTPARVAGFVQALRAFLAHWPGCLYRSNGVEVPLAQAGL